MSNLELVGYFDVPMPRDIPWLPVAAVHLVDRGIVVPADSVDDLDTSTASFQTQLTLEQFNQRATAGHCLAVTHREWDTNNALLVSEAKTGPEYLPLPEVEHRLRAFVDLQRKRGYKALDNRRPDIALAHFDRARRVSNERADYVRVWALEEPPLKQTWERWLRAGAPDIEPLAEAVDLLVIPRTAVFRTIPRERAESQTAPSHEP